MEWWSDGVVEWRSYGTPMTPPLHYSITAFQVSALGSGVTVLPAA